MLKPFWFDLDTTITTNILGLFNALEHYCEITTKPQDNNVTRVFYLFKDEYVCFYKHIFYGSLIYDSCRIFIKDFNDSNKLIYAGYNLSKDSLTYDLVKDRKYNKNINNIVILTKKELDEITFGYSVETGIFTNERL